MATKTWPTKPQKGWEMRGHRTSYPMKQTNSDTQIPTAWPGNIPPWHPNTYHPNTLHARRLTDHKTLPVWIQVEELQTTLLSAHSWWTVPDLRQAISRECGIPSHLLTIRFKGRQLSPNSRISHILKPGAFLRVVLNGLQGGVKGDRNKTPTHPLTPGQRRATEKPQADPTACAHNTDSTSVSPLWRKWADLMATADSLRIFRNPRSLVQKTARKLSTIVTPVGHIPSQLVTMGATALCIASMGEGPILSTLYTGQKWKFEKYCESAKTGPRKHTPNEPDEAATHLWELSSAVLKPVLNALQEKLPKTVDTMVLYKGLQAPNNHALEEIIRDLMRTIPRSWIWSSSIETAINAATPNKGMKGKLSLIDRRLLRKGHSDLVTNYTGIVLCYKTRAIPIGTLTPTISTDEFFVDFNQNCTWNIRGAHIPAEKTQLICPLLPPTPQPALPKIIDSDLWIATITNCSTTDTNINTASLENPAGRNEPHITTPRHRIAKERGKIQPMNTPATGDKPKNLILNPWKPAMNKASLKKEASNP